MITVLASLLLLGAAPPDPPADGSRDSGFAPCADVADFPELAGSRCARFAVPLDRRRVARDDRIELFVRRFPARGERRGEVWFVAGGPGESGASFYPFLDTLRQGFPGFDLVFPDHRGTGLSSRICPVEEAADSEDGFALGGSEWGPCISSAFADAERTQAFTVTEAALDLSELIGRTREEGETLVYGVSYGTQLALRMMQVAPPELDGLVLDGLVPPDDDPRWDLSHRTQVVDQTGRTFLGSEDEAAYSRLLASAADAAWRDRIPGGDLKRFMGMLLDFPVTRRRLPELITGLTMDDTVVLDQVLVDLKAVTDRLGRYPQSAPSLPLVILISGSENNLRPDLTRETVTAELDAALFTSPLAGFLVDPPMPLYGRDRFWNGTPARLPRTLVLHGDLDPKTPHEGAVAHVERLRAVGPVRLATVEGAPHFIAFAAPDCFTRLTAAFVSGAEPEERCVMDER